MTINTPLFDINTLDGENQTKFHMVYNELKLNHTSYVQYKLNLQLKKKVTMEEEENEWCYELHRFLRARKWNVIDTIKSIRDMIRWRIDNHVDSILEDQSIILRMNLIRKMAPSAHHGYTKAGRPLFIEKLGLVHVDKLFNQFTPEELIQCHIYWLEFCCQRARERSRQLEKHVENFATIYDLHGCKLELTKFLHVFKQSVYIDDNYYPERLGQMFLINPPMIFPVLWDIAKYWLDPVTKTKIHVIRKGPETSTALLQHIDYDQLPHEYGGTCQSCPTAPNCIPVYVWNKDGIDEKQERQLTDPSPKSSNDGLNIKQIDID